MRHPIGFSTGFFYKIDRALAPAEKLRRLARSSTEVLELHLSDLLDGDWNPTPEETELIGSFAYRSIHLPGYVRYPGPETKKMLTQLPRIIEAVRPHTAVLHPDAVDDFQWVADTFAPFECRLAVENMDWRKTVGITVESMRAAFERLPDAGWVFDVNHIYTLDPSMELGRQLYAAFSDRLVHYHVSGFGGPESLHACLADTHEDEILACVFDDGKPLVLESVAEKTTEDPRVELEYIQSRLYNA